MRTLTSSLLLILSLCFFPAYSEEDHDHDHDHDHDTKEAHIEENAVLLKQLGFAMATVEDRKIAGNDVTAVPASAIFFEEGKAFVIARDENDPHSFTRWEVQPGTTDGRFVEAKSGVFPGDQIITRERPLLAFQTDKLERVSSVAQRVTKEKVTPSQTGNFGVQIGAFSKEENARRVADQLKKQFGRTDVLFSETKGRSLYRVRVGEYQSLKSAKDTREKLLAGGFPGAFVVAFN